MTPALSVVTLLWILVTLEISEGGTESNRRRNYPSAKAEVFKICEMLCSLSPFNENLTFVFILYVGPEFEISFDYLWKLPRALVYLSVVDVILRDREREIVISWERDPGPIRRDGKTTYWNLDGMCGHRPTGCATQDGFVETQFRLENRILIQIREWSREDPLRNPLTANEHIVRANYYSFYKRYRATFIIVRLENKDRLHSRISVRRTGSVIGTHLLKLAAENFHMDHVRSVFASPHLSMNGSEVLDIRFQFATYRGTGSWEGFFFGSCIKTNKAFVHAFEYQTVRLAVPLPWETRLISTLPKYLKLEVPLTLLSLLALPMLFSIRRHRVLHPVSSTWSTAWHLLSGDDNDSLISSAKRGAHLLLVSGIVSLLLQYPINLLKGEVVRSPYEQRVQPSNCTVHTCLVNGGRSYLFYADRDGNVVGRLEKEDNLAGLISETSMKEACLTFSDSSTGMMKWTALAFLTQYLTVCEEPALMSMHVASWGEGLAFESIRSSDNTEAVCSLQYTSGSHIEPRKHYRLTQWILEHDLLQYPHVQSSLFVENTYEQEFWNRQWIPDQDTVADPIRVARKVAGAVAILNDKYTRFEMFKHESDFRAVDKESLRHLFVFFLGVTLSLIFFTHLKYTITACMPLDRLYEN